MKTLVFPATVVLLIPAWVTGAGLDLAPDVAPQFKPGDQVAVATAGAPLMRGAQVLGTLGQGQRAVVADLRDSWIGVYVRSGEEQKSGWLRVTDLIPAGAACPAGPVTHTAAYTPAQPAPVLAAVPQPVPVYPQRAAADPFLIGRYQRHEVDPNMHVWEPWRR